MRAVVESPVGPLGLTWDDEGLVGVTFGAVRKPEDQNAASTDAEPVTQLREYLAGTRREFTVEPRWELTPEPARHVLRTLVRIAPFGSTVSYGELASASGLPADASRQVGRILNGNRWPVIVPCHRVLMSDGSLGGFGGGVWRKERLLQLEGSLTMPLWS